VFGMIFDNYQMNLGNEGMPIYIQAAYQRVIHGMGQAAFDLLSARDQAEAIHAEILNLDAENLQRAVEWDHQDGREVFQCMRALALQEGAPFRRET
jgi:hypothetical protein